MSSKRKARSNRSKNKQKPKRKQQDLKRNSIDENEMISNDVPLSLSPFYSFSSHWSYITRQYLCLSTWGTCMGGINEQYDDIMDQEASLPIVQTNYKRAMDRWNKQNDKYLKKKEKVEKFNKYQQVQYDKFNTKYKQFYDTVTNNSSNNNYYISNHSNNTNNQYDRNLTNNRNKPKPVYSVSHKVPDWKYPDKSNMNKPMKPAMNESDSASLSVSDISYKTPPRQNTNSDKMEAENDDYKQSDQRYLDSPDRNKSVNNEKRSSHHVKGKSFARKMNLFQTAAEMKRRRTVEEKEWKKQHSHSSVGTTDDGSPQRKFKPIHVEGTQYMEQFAFSPAAHGATPTMKRKMSQRDYSKHMKTLEDKDAIVLDDKLATSSVSDKAKMFQQMSAGYEDE